MEHTRRDLENDAYARLQAAENKEPILEELRNLLVQHANAVIFAVLRKSDPALSDSAANRVLLNLPSFRGDVLFTTWAHKIILSETYDQRRIERRNKETPILDILGFDAQGTSSVEALDVLLTVEKVLDPEEHRLFELMVLEGRTQEEAGVLLTKTQSTLSKEWASVRRKLRNAFTK